MKDKKPSEPETTELIEPETSELDYIEQLMDDFGLEKANTIGDLLECLENEGFEDEDTDDGNV